MGARVSYYEKRDRKLRNKQNEVKYMKHKITSIRQTYLWNGKTKKRVRRTVAFYEKFCAHVLRESGKGRKSFEETSPERRKREGRFIKGKGEKFNVFLDIR